MDIVMIGILTVSLAGMLGLLAWCGSVASEGSEPQ